MFRREGVVWRWAAGRQVTWRKVGRWEEVSPGGEAAEGPLAREGVTTPAQFVIPALSTVPGKVDAKEMLVG